MIDWPNFRPPTVLCCVLQQQKTNLSQPLIRFAEPQQVAGASVTNRYPEMPFFFLKKTAIQKDQKHQSFSPRCFFSLKKRFSNAPKSVYLFHTRASLCQKKASRHFEKLVTLSWALLTVGPNIAKWLVIKMKPNGGAFSHHSTPHDDSRQRYITRANDDEIYSWKKN